jgi:phospholipid-transporting ATPase
MAVREIPEREYKEWVTKFNEAATAIVDRGDKVSTFYLYHCFVFINGCQLDAVAELIERDFELLGATAIEDKLQDGVPDAIYTLAQVSSMKIFLLQRHFYTQLGWYQDLGAYRGQTRNGYQHWLFVQTFIR